MHKRVSAPSASSAVELVECSATGLNKGDATSFDPVTDRSHSGFTDVMVDDVDYAVVLQVPCKRTGLILSCPMFVPSLS